MIVFLNSSFYYRKHKLFEIVLKKFADFHEQIRQVINMKVCLNREGEKKCKINFNTLR